MPCGHCPHGAACCQDGAALSLEERDAIIAHHGAHTVVWDQDTVDDGWPGWRTATVAGDGTGCVFLDGAKRCTIYDASYYPRICRGFPWFDDTLVEPYDDDVDFCPEFLTRPELVPLTRSGRVDGLKPMTTPKRHPGRSA
jgi:Fe-S-cluster containining protein